MDRQPRVIVFVMSMALVGAGCTTDLQQGPDWGGTGGDGNFRDAGVDQGAPCTSNSDCSGGYCVNGRCCPSKEQVCGSSCCQVPQVCFANACVVPGKFCYSAGDCPKGWYCEPGVGPDGGVDAGKAPDGRVCLKPAPRKGRCLKLPPRCPATDAGPPSGDAGCLPPCEYHPPKGKLQTVKKWTWGPVAKEYASYTDVWSTPAVGRVYDTNCDGTVNELDPPSVVVVSGNAKGTCCHCSGSNMCARAVLRLLDGETGKEIWSLNKAYAKSMGFAAISPAIGTVYKGSHKGGPLDIAAVTGEGKVVLVDGNGKVKAVSDKVIPGYNSITSFGWGGGLALGDMDGDGSFEIAFGRAVFTTKGGKVTRLFVGPAGLGGGYPYQALSIFSALAGAADGHLELVAGNTVYKSDGSILWRRKDLYDGYPGVADFDGDGTAEVVLVAQGKVYVLDGKTGKTTMGPLALGGSGKGGPPTVADFDGDGKPEIGVAQANYYSMVKPDPAQKKLVQVWKARNHDLSSSVTGSTVFDFEGDGVAEVVYNDECFLWVYDGKTGKIRFATPTLSFTGTEASLVADVNGDGKAEMLMVSNGANPGAGGWKCNVSPWNKADPVTGRPAWKPPAGQKVYRGLTLWAGKANTWVGTRTLWNQHTYHVTNICDDRDNACVAPNVYGLIPKSERKNWTVKWLNNFRQNVQDKGLFDAPDATLTLKVDCSKPVKLRAYVRNYGLALLPLGVEVGFYVVNSGAETLLGKAKTKTALYPGQVAELTYSAKTADKVSIYDTFVAAILTDPKNPKFNECRKSNNKTKPAKAFCLN